jgi:hypothetical protein
VRQASGEVEHVPARADEFGGAQAVPAGDQDHAWCVAVGVMAEAVAAGLAQGLDRPPRR